MNGAAFDTCIETQLAPALDPGTVVILKNHKSPRAAEVLRRHGSWFLFLPACSPDLNPTSRDIACAMPCRSMIEMAFSKLKAHLRRIEARTFDALFKALGDICEMFDPDGCWNFLKAAGFASD